MKHSSGTWISPPKGLLALSCLLLAWCNTASAGNLRDRLEHLLIEAGVAVDEQLEEVSIFGDGDPQNGVEDSRIDMASDAWRALSRQPWSLSGGAIHCDGKNRGSGMIVDTRELGRPIRGHIVLTSAHVLYDLERGRLFRDCRFHYMGLQHVADYQGFVELGRSRLGDFDPSGVRNRPEFGRGDWALLYVTGLPREARRVRLRAYADLHSPAGAHTPFQFLSYSRTLGGMTVSSACHVVESVETDLGGGGWAGHLLDDCDSESGASGGGLIANVDGAHYLVGVRSGTHWDDAVFPTADFPGGPPPGSVWNVHSHTNFARAVDDILLASLREMLSELSQEQNKSY